MQTETRTIRSTISSKCRMHAKDVVHPSHEAVLPRLRRAQGQLAGIERMILDERYCVDILIQLRAATSAMRAVEDQVFGTHVKSCVRAAMSAKNPRELDRKVDEIIALLKRHS